MSVLTAIPACFADSYADARARFHAAAAGAMTKTYDNPMPGPDGGALATDCLWVGPVTARRVFVMMSATHGVEGFCGSACQIDWLRQGGPAALPADAAVLLVHAINPHGFAWQRRVTEEGCDLNRNYIDFDQPVPDNPGHDALVDCFVPAALDDASLAAADAKIAAYRAEHGERAFQMARKQGQYKHAHSVFFGGFGPTWARRTLETIIDDFELPARELTVVVDYHTGLGPHGHGEPICGHAPASPGFRRVIDMYGDFVGVPDLGTSVSIPIHGSSREMWDRKLGDAYTYVALEFGTYPPDQGLKALRADHWLHAQGPVDWADPTARAIKDALKHQYDPAITGWREAVLWRSRQVQRQSLAGLYEEENRP